MQISGIRVLGAVFKILSINFSLDHMPFTGMAGPLRAASQVLRLHKKGLLSRVFRFEHQD